MTEKTFGNRRNEQELQQFKDEKLRLKYRLIEQPNFNGSPELLEEMQKYERAYREGTPVITDEEWDDLVKKTGYVESLDQVVAPSGRRWIRMGAPLVSLKKIDKIESVEKMVQPGKLMVIGPKLDGLTYSAFYIYDDHKNLIYDSIGTRGDGVHSLLLHSGALDGVTIYGLPKFIDAETAVFLEENGCVVDGRFELRGEAMIDKYRYCEENGLDVETLVPRSISAGMFNRIVSSSLKYFIDTLWGKLGRPEFKNGFNQEEAVEINKSHTKETKKFLSSFGIIGRKSDISSVIAVKIGVNIAMYVSYKEDSSKFELETGTIGNLRVEHLHMISFSVASKHGNIDRPDILNAIPGVKYVGSVEDFKDIYAVTDSPEEAVRCVDNLYGTVRGVRDKSKERIKVTCRFALDGIVIKPLDSDAESQKLVGVKKQGKLVISTKPADQVAIKLPTDPVRTRIIELVRTTTTLGNVTVRATIEPTVAEGGATIKSVNLHNENWLSLPENQWIKEGAECDLRLSMDIIPILSPIEE